MVEEVATKKKRPRIMVGQGEAPKVEAEKKSLDSAQADTKRKILAKMNQRIQDFKDMSQSERPMLIKSHLKEEKS